MLASGGGVWVAAVGWTALRARRLAPDGEAAGMRAALVLGCPPGPALDARVDGAIALWRAGRAERIVVSGAGGEADAGRARAIAAGVPAEAVVIEPAARDTWENLALSRALVGDGPLWVVSDRWHLPRALRFAVALGIDARPWPIERAAPPRMLAREGLATVYGLLRRRG